MRRRGPKNGTLSDFCNSVRWHRAVAARSSRARGPTVRPIPPLLSDVRTVAGPRDRGEKTATDRRSRIFLAIIVPTTVPRSRRPQTHRRLKRRSASELQPTANMPAPLWERSATSHPLSRLTDPPHSRVAPANSPQSRQSEKCKFHACGRTPLRQRESCTPSTQL